MKRYSIAISAVAVVGLATALFFNCNGCATYDTSQEKEKRKTESGELSVPAPMPEEVHARDAISAKESYGANAPEYPKTSRAAQTNEDAMHAREGSYARAPMAAGSELLAKKMRIIGSAPSQFAPTAIRPNGLRAVNDKKFYDMYFKHYGVNPTIDTEEEPFSTFSIDVDNGSYTMARSFLNRSAMPDEAAIRVEEFVNAFDYGYHTPTNNDPFNVHAEAFPSPNRKGYHVLHIGLKGKEIKSDKRKPANLVFVVDTSGSMSMESRLGLVKRGLNLLVDQLTEKDSVAIVAYGSHAYSVLNPTSGSNKGVIRSAIGNLVSTGSTNAQAGIKMGYELAAQKFREGAINRVILCSDGVANNGISTSADGIFNTVKDKARLGVTISTIGFGMSNYNDTLMEQLANKGNGNYAYVDSFDEAKRVFVENLTGMLQVIAKDVKIQVEFDKKAVSRYRLLGYENRWLAKEDFSNDKVDAGEIGAGHTVTALYEVKFRKDVNSHNKDFGKLNIRYKAPEGSVSKIMVKSLPVKIAKNSFAKATPASRLSLAVAGFAEKLRGSYWARNLSYDSIIKTIDETGSRFSQRQDVTELKKLVVAAKSLDRRADKFEGDSPLAMIDFDHIPVLK